MASIVRGSAANMSKRRVRMPSGDQSPILTVYGSPPSLIRVESEEYLHLAQAIANELGRVFVVTPTRTIAAERNQATPATTGQGRAPAPMQTAPTGILQADQYARPSNGAAAPQIPAGVCPRCAGTKQTARGATCPVCNGRGMTR